MDEPPNNEENSADPRAVSIRALRFDTKNIISTLLNPVKILNSDKGLPRYWLGLAELCGIGGEEISNLRGSNDPSLAVLNLWYRKNPNVSTVVNLFKHLETLDRFDVIDDIKTLVDEDIKHFKENPDISRQNPPIIDEYDVLIRGDVESKFRGEDLKIYDAFVLFADEDVDFASVLKQTMQNEPYNLELCTKEDLLGGCIEIDAMIRCISSRCKRLVVILSPDFFRSNANFYYTKFAQMEGIELRKRKIIPCVCRTCTNLPPDFRMYYLLDYERSRKLGIDFWSQLYNSLISSSLAQSLSENSTVMKKSMETLKIESKPINHVKFNSMVNLNTENVNEKPEIQVKETVSPSSSHNSLEPYQGSLKKKNSIYKKLKNMVHSKSAKHSEETEKSTNNHSSIKTNEGEQAQVVVNSEKSPAMNGHIGEEKPKKKKPPKVWVGLQKKFTKVKVVAN